LGEERNILSDVYGMQSKRRIHLDMPRDSEGHMAEMALLFEKDNDFSHRGSRSRLG